MISKAVREAERAAKAKAIAEHKIRANRIVPIDEVLLWSNDDYPHIRMGGKWKVQFGVLCEYGERLRKAKIPDAEIGLIFRELFWACQRELEANGMFKKPKAKK